MAEHVEIHFVGEVVLADRVEEVGPGLVGQFELVDRVNGKHPAVVFRDIVLVIAEYTCLMTDMHQVIILTVRLINTCLYRDLFLRSIFKKISPSFEM